MSLTIPGVETVHERSVWLPDGYNMDTDFDRKPPAARPATDIDVGAIHYTSAIDLPDGDPDEIVGGVDGIRRLLARTQIDYLTNRTGGNYKRKSDGRVFPGYSVGYNFAVDWLGGVWEIRGWDYKAGATASHNNHTLAILMLTDRHDPASDLMLRSARMILREQKRRGANRLANTPWAHGWFLERTGTGSPTACCGVPVKAQITAGLLDLDYPETPEPDPIEPPTEDEEIMTTVLIKPKAAYFGGGVFTVDGHPVSPEALAALKAAGPVVVIEQDHPWWDAATWDRLGSDGRRRYVELANG